MSRDLRIISSTKPVLDGLTDRVAQLGGWIAEATDGGTWLRRSSDPERSVGFGVDGPVRVEPEDLPDELAAAVLLPRWLTQINVPLAAGQRDWETALGVGRHLADRSAGILYDPQAERIVWPRSRQRRLPRLEEQPSSQVAFAWAMPPAGFTQQLPAQLLAWLRRSLPEALPRRFGSFEPLQGHLEDGDDAFVSLWREEQASGAGTLFWTANAPARGGSVSFPPARAPDAGVAAGSLEIGLDGRLFDDPRWREMALVLLDEIGVLSAAFYGRALCERRPAADISASALLDMAPAPVWRGAWLGLPDHPTWLTWLSPVYADVVADAMPAVVVQRTRHGTFVRLSDAPLTAAEYLPLSERFPAAYCRSGAAGPDDRSSAAERISAPPRPARCIPPMADG